MLFVSELFFWSNFVSELAYVQDFVGLVVYRHEPIFIFSLYLFFFLRASFGSWAVKQDCLYQNMNQIDEMAEMNKTGYGEKKTIHFIFFLFSSI